MAQLEGPLKIRGTFGGMTIDKNGVVRTKNPSTKDKFMNSKSMARVRENAAEFKTAAGSAKLVGDAFRVCVTNTKEAQWFSRLQQSMRAVIALDTTNDRGSRGVIDDETRLLVGYNFSKVGLSSILFISPQVALTRNDGKCKIDVPAHEPSKSVSAPTGATHYRLLSCSVAVNFEEGSSNATNAVSEYLPLSVAETAALTLQIDQEANVVSPVLIGLGIEFYQKIGNKYYELNNNANNAFDIVAVDTGVVVP